MSAPDSRSQPVTVLDALQFIALLELLEEAADYAPDELNRRIFNVLDYHTDHDTVSTLPRPNHSPQESE